MLDYISSIKKDLIHMKRIILIFFLIFALVICGCTPVPQSVSDSIEKYNKSEAEEASSDFSYIDVSELQNTSQQAVLKDYGQFNISDNINFDIPTEINVMSFKPFSGFLSNARKAMDLFFTEEQLSHQQISNDGEYYEFYNENDKLYGSVCDDGFIAVLKPDAFDISFGYTEPNVKIYHVDRKDDLTDEYQLKDGKCSIKEAVKYIDNWLETSYKPFLPIFDYNVKTVIVREHDSNYLFEISAEASYNGVPIDSYTTELDTNTVNLLMSNYRIEMQMISKFSIDSFTNRTDALILSEIDSLKECVSLESALNYCRNTFTDFKDIQISDIGVMYTLLPIYEYDEENRPHIVKYDSRPVWKIVMDVPIDEVVRKGQVNTNGDLRRYIYIDMVTGECKYNFDIVKQGLGE